MNFKRMRHWICVLAALAGTLSLADESRAPAAPSVWMVELDGAVGPASADLVIRAIDDAADAGAQALVIRMDTPGGLDKSMRDVVKAILAARIPVVTYVAPDGARAASAGTYIAFASHIAAMAPATNIGSSTPVSIAPGPAPTAPSPGQPGPESAPDDGSDSDKPKPATPASSDAMTRKVVNDAVAYLQSLAELRGRNVEWAEETVRVGANIRASQAVEQNVVDLVATDLDDLLRQIDGRQVKAGGVSMTLHTVHASVVRVETDWRHELLAIITDPSIAYGLLIFGVYGLILEFYNPGMIFPAVLGVICLLLGAYGLQMLPVNYVGLALVVVGMGMMIAEVFTPTYGVLGLGGVTGFVMGSIMLIDSDLPGFRLPLTIITGFAVATGALAFFAIGAAVRARQAKVVTGPASMIGAPARVLEDFEGTGWVHAFGERWRARCDRPLSRDARVRVTAIDGLMLTVEPEE